MKTQHHWHFLFPDLPSQPHWRSALSTARSCYESYLEIQSLLRGRVLMQSSLTTTTLLNPTAYLFLTSAK